MLNGQTILVVEEEFLIALDIQRMLEKIGAGQTLFARSAGEAQAMTNYWPTLALAIVEVPAAGHQAVQLARALQDSGVRLVLCTASSSLRRGHPEFPGVPVVVKPLAEDDLGTAIEALRLSR